MAVPKSDTTETEQRIRELAADLRAYRQRQIVDDGRAGRHGSESDE
jgi:hypothetical protein